MNDEERALVQRLLYRFWFAAIDASMIVMAVIFGWPAAIGMLGGLALSAGFLAFRDHRREQKRFARRAEIDRKLISALASAHEVSTHLAKPEPLSEEELS